MSHYLPLIPLLFSLLLTPTLSAEETQPEPQKIEVQEQNTAYIELSDIPAEAAKMTVALKGITEELTESAEVLEIETVIESYIASIDMLLEDPIYSDLTHQNARELQKLDQQWKIYNKELKASEQIINERIEIYDKRRITLKEYSTLWSETHINATKVSAPPAIQEHIANVIIAIEILRNHAKTNYDKFLTGSNLITTRIVAIDEKVEQINEAENVLETQVFYQNQAPLSVLFSQDKLSPTGYIKGIVQNLSEKYNEFAIYNQTHVIQQLNLFIGSLIIIIFVAYFNFLYRKNTLFVSKGSLSKKEYFFIGLPFSTILILIVLLSVFTLSDAPKSVREMLLYLVMIPTVRIMLTVVHKKVMPYFYAYFVLYFLSLMEKNAIGFDLDDRIFNILISISLISVIIIFIQKKAADFMSFGIIKTIIYRSLPLVLLLLVISIVSNFYGAVLLSERIAHGVFTAIHASVIFYAITIILSGYVIILFRRRISSTSNILDQYAAKIERTTTTIIKLFMVVWWFKILARILGLEDKIGEFVTFVLELSWVVGSTTISIASVVSFVSILVGTWLLARFVDVILDVEVFSRVKLSRGMPTAISTVLNYIIVISGILIALSSLGVSTEQFALVFGALGVGIGFGLRNIIANFVSGVIMVFERPIQIGDTIEVDNTMGKVIKIGTRASAIQTFDGSEVIMPNEQFISSKIINWTLSDERRRKTLNIKVAFDSDIEAVLNIMSDVALAHESVLKEPRPLPTFQGFGDYYLEFKLYYWLADNLIVAQSDIAIGVYKRLKEEKIATPMPKQEFIMPQDKA